MRTRPVPSNRVPAASIRLVSRGDGEARRDRQACTRHASQGQGLAADRGEVGRGIQGDDDPSEHHWLHRISAVDGATFGTVAQHGREARGARARADGRR